MSYDPLSPFSNDPARSAYVAQLLQAREAAVAAAWRSAQRAADVGDELSDYAGGTSPFVVEDARGIHYLRPEGGLFGGATYCVRVDVPGVLPAMLLVARAAAAPGDGRSFGPVVPLRDPALDAHFVARCRAPDLVRSFDLEELGRILPTQGVRVALRPEDTRRTVVELDAAVGRARRCSPAAAAARMVVGVARALVGTGLVFAERARGGPPTAAQVETMLARLGEATHWLSGPVARVGDGVEARLALDEQPELASVLRVDVDGGGRSGVFFEGRFATAWPRITTLRPQEDWLDRLRGLADTRIGDVTFDAAWLCDGDVEVVRLLAASGLPLQRLRSLRASIDLGPAGLVVRVPPIEDDDGDVIACCDAILTLWRTLARRQRGFDATG